MNRRTALKRTMILTGTALSTSALASLMQSCQPNASAAEEWIPEFFSVGQGATIRQVADQILPKTDTPSASEVGVPEFIDLIVKDCMKPEDQQRFLLGLDAFQKDAQAKLGKAFIDAEGTDQLAYLQQVDEAAKAEAERIEESEKGKDPFAEAGEEDDGPDMPFFIDLKSMVIAGYFSSEEIGKNVLSYDPIPGEQKGCIPLSEVGNSWSL